MDRSSRFRIGGLEVDSGARRIRGGDGEVRVEPKVFDLLVYFSENPGRVIGQDELLEAVWGRRVASDAVVTQAIFKLRQLFKDSGGIPDALVTLRGAGYRLDVAPEPLDEPDPTLPSKWYSDWRLSASLAVLCIGLVVWWQLWQTASQAGPRIALLELEPLAVEFGDERYLETSRVLQMRLRVADHWRDRGGPWARSGPARPRRPRPAAKENTMTQTTRLRNPFLSLSLACASLLLVPVPALSQSADDGFDPNPDQQVHGLAVQADGKILACGRFTEVGGQPRPGVARLNPDGSVDAGFDPGANDAVVAMALRADGSIPVAGSFGLINGSPPNRQNFYLRANGQTATGFGNSSASRVEHTRQFHVVVDVVFADRFGDF